VQGTRLARGAAALAAVFLALGLALGGEVPLFIGLGLLALVAVRAARFDRACRRVTGSLRVERALARRLVLEMHATQVTTRISLAVPGGLSVGLREVLPPGISLTGGALEAEVAGTGGRDPVEVSLPYEVTPLVHGTLPFPGVSLRIADRFFTREVSVGTPAAGDREILVQPHPAFEPSRRTGEFGTREIERSAFITGLGIRGFREYRPGDDLRQIDWKLSAKHEKLLIREYMGLMHQGPLLVIDLPDRAAPYDPAAFQRMVRGIAGSVEHSLRSGGHAAYLLVSGMNIVSLVSEEKQVSAALSRLRENLHPVDRPVHAYHALERREIRARARRIRGGEPQMKSLKSPPSGRRSSGRTILPSRIPPSPISPGRWPGPSPSPGGRRSSSGPSSRGT
jgi:uncharacterized protein (DUF58 family)